jgi:hypothetical protein
LLNRITPVPLALLTLCLGSGCEDLSPKLAAAITDVADSVTITETEVIAKCKDGNEAKVPVSQLELDFLGMADIEKQTAVAKALKDQCESFTREKKQAEAATNTLHEAAKQLKIDHEGKEDDALRTEICDVLKARLPKKDPERADAVTQNTRRFSCPDPGPPEVGPEKMWMMSEDGEGKAKTLYAKLHSTTDDGEGPERFVIKCKGKKLTAYLTSEKRMKKTKKLALRFDKGTGSYAATMAKDKKSIFFKRPTKDLKKMLAKKKMTVTYPVRSRKKYRATFEIDGMRAAIKPMRKACRF